MNRLVPLLSLLFSMLATPVFAANNASAMDDRLCNLQAREIALRISEELDSDYTARQRDEISRIAEEVCKDYSTQSSTLPVINRPAGSQAMPMSAQERSQQATSQRLNASESKAMTSDDVSDTSDSAAEEESDGIIGGLKIIDPEDRVRRPGLKRR